MLKVPNRHTVWSETTSENSFYYNSTTIVKLNDFYDFQKCLNFTSLTFALMTAA